MQEKIAKLPVCTREHIKSLKQERDAAVRTLNEFCNNQTPSPFRVVDNPCTGEASGPQQKTHYIQAHAIEVEYDGVYLRVGANPYGNRDNGIKLTWGGSKFGCEHVAFVPTSFQSAVLVNKKDMR
jgi:hypothetical protein